MMRRCHLCGAIHYGCILFWLPAVAEVFYERDFGGVTITSALVGAIWQVRDNIAFDVGLRGAQVNDQPLREVRFGVTFGFPVR